MACSRLLILLVFLRAPLCFGAPAEPEPQPRVSESRRFWALATGLAGALVPMTVGAGLVANSSARGFKYAGLDLIDTGLVLGPYLAHAIVGEDERAALFAMPTLLGAVGMNCLFAAAPDVVEESTLEARVAFVIVLSVNVASSTIAFIDSFMATARQRRPRLRLAPLVGPAQVGVVLRGNL